MLVRPRSLASFSKSMPFSKARARTDGGAMMSLMSAPLPAGRDVLGFHELKHTFMPAFTPQARLLHATEGGGWVADQPTVQADHAVFEPFTDLQGAFHVSGKNIGNKAVFGIICTLDDIFLVPKGLNGRDRTEYFVMHTFGIFGDVRQNCWRVVKTRAVRDSATAFDLGALGDRVCHEFG